MMNTDILIYIDTINKKNNRHIWIGWIKEKYKNNIHVNIECLHLIKEDNIYKYSNEIITISTISTHHKNIILIKNANDEIIENIKEIAKNIEIVNNCHDWIKNLLNNMIKKEIITQDKVKKVKEELNF